MLKAEVRKPELRNPAWGTLPGGPPGTPGTRFPFPFLFFFFTLTTYRTKQNTCFLKPIGFIAGFWRSGLARRSCLVLPVVECPLSVSSPPPTPQLSPRPITSAALMCHRFHGDHEAIVLYHHQWCFIAGPGSQPTDSGRASCRFIHTYSWAGLRNTFGS